MRNVFQVKAEKIFLQNDHDCHAKGPFSNVYEICVANFLKFSEEKAISLPISEI